MRLLLGLFFSWSAGTFSVPKKFGTTLCGDCSSPYELFMRSLILLLSNICSLNSYEIKQIVIRLVVINNEYVTTQYSMDIYDFPPFKKYPRDISLYHPNEIVAYMIPKLIIK